MHEIGIANSILDAVKAETCQRPGSVPRKVAVRIGELAGVDPEALRFAFEVLSPEAGFRSLQLEIEMCPRRHFCPECNSEFQLIDLDPYCPRCGREATTCIRGDELEIAYLEMEEYEPSTA